MELLRQREHHMKAMYHQVLSMGTHVEEALSKALHVLLDRNFQVAQEIHDHDPYIDTCQKAIEESCIHFIETRKPNETTLRELITLIKVSSDLERIGDLAQHLARTIQNAGDPLVEQTQPQLERMIRLGIDMLHQSLIALTAKDTDLAERIALQDSLIDTAHHELDNHIISVMKESPEFIESGVELLRLSRFLERLGDRVINICEWIFYAKNGVHRDL